MSVPNEFAFGRLKMGDGDSPEAFPVLCGIQDIAINKVANTQDRFVRDCDTPNLPGNRKVKSTGKQMDVTGTGLTNKTNVPLFEAALGVVKNYLIECYSDDGTPTGNLEGTYAGAFMLTADNSTLSQEGDSSAEITLASNGAWTWTPA